MGNGERRFGEFLIERYILEWRKFVRYDSLRRSYTQSREPKRYIFNVRVADDIDAQEDQFVLAATASGAKQFPDK